MQKPIRILLPYCSSARQEKSFNSKSRTPTQMKNALLWCYSHHDFCLHVYVRRLQVLPCTPLPAYCQQTVQRLCSLHFAANSEQLFKDMYILFKKLTLISTLCFVKAFADINSAIAWMGSLFPEEAERECVIGNVAHLKDSFRDFLKIWYNGRTKVERRFRAWRRPYLTVRSASDKHEFIKRVFHWSSCRWWTYTWNKLDLILCTIQSEKST